MAWEIRTGWEPLGQATKQWKMQQLQADAHTNSIMSTQKVPTVVEKTDKRAKHWWKMPDYSLLYGTFVRVSHFEFLDTVNPKGIKPWEHNIVKSHLGSVKQSERILQGIMCEQKHNIWHTMPFTTPKASYLHFEHTANGSVTHRFTVGAQWQRHMEV